ncbi:hypothetical protein BGZ92_009800 [Podila epicladia]|nr:hypothetical protein BGZ92_009800 [Podila epicladia]
MSLVVLNSAQAYGALGHTLTGQIAQRLLTRKTAEQVKEILPSNFDGLLSKAALWADNPAKRLRQYKSMTGEENGFLVQKLIAMSGVRMAAILNQIYDPQ